MIMVIYLSVKEQLKDGLQNARAEKTLKDEDAVCHTILRNSNIYRTLVMSNKLEDAMVDMRFLLCDPLTSLAVEQIRVSRLSWDLRFVLRDCFVLRHHVTGS